KNIKSVKIKKWVRSEDEVNGHVHWIAEGQRSERRRSSEYAVLVASLNLLRMDLVASCKDKLAYFRIKELKDVLTQLGLSKQGKKQDLVDRILDVLSDEQVLGTWAKKNAFGKEGVAKLVDDTYRKMQFSGAADLASITQAISDSASAKHKEEAEDSYPMEKIRCVCGSTLATDSMIKCEDPRCNIWQHKTCVLIHEKTMEGVLPNPPDIFFCEICRLSRADPFWSTVAHLLYPVKLNITSVPADGSSPSQSIEKTFQLTRADRDLLSKQEYDVQAWCMLLNDKVTFRMQWPQYADLQINGVPVRVINRPGSQLLGANGRDDGPVITPCTRDGINKIFLGGCDARIFCVGVRIVKRRTLQQVLNIIPKESEGEVFEDALARVRRCVGGGAATENADSDSDIEVVADFIPVNLRCPMQKCGEDVAEIEVKPDGSWRAKVDGGNRTVFGELGLWHSPDGTICAPTEAESKPNPELKQVKQELGSNSHPIALKLEMRKNPNGRWIINKPENSPNIIIPMSSSATGSGRDYEDASVNQVGGPTTLDFSVVNGAEYESITPAGGDADVIVLSDSDEEEIEPLTSSGGAVCKIAGAADISVPDQIPDPPYYGNGGNSCLGIFSANEDDFGNMWSLPCGSQGGFQLFGSDVDVNNDPYTMTADETVMGSAAAGVLPELGQNSNSNGGLVDNPLAFGASDPALQIFLPTRPSNVSGPPQLDSRGKDVANGGVGTEDWISLRLGGREGESGSGQQVQSGDGGLGTLADSGM
ncbi:DNA-binding protein with MIZ/SP-RING zinc finger, partial [Striga asiatica]